MCAGMVKDQIKLVAPWRARSVDPGPSRDWLKVKNPDSPAMIRAREAEWRRAKQGREETFLDPVDPQLLERANWWFDVSWYGLLLAGGATALAAAATVVFLFLQFWSSGVRERQSDWRTYLSRSKPREQTPIWGEQKPTLPLPTFVLLRRQHGPRRRNWPSKI